jgi:hypothetical protein
MATHIVAKDKLCLLVTFPAVSPKRARRRGEVAFGTSNLPADALFQMSTELYQNMPGYPCED